MSFFLRKLIDQGEHQQQDFKFCINDSKKIAKSLVAFANTDGGRLLIGVKDNGNIVGVKSDEEYYMAEAAANIYSKPPVLFTTQQWPVEGKTVLEIKIEASDQKPHFAKDETGNWIAYIRKNDENIVVNRIQIEVWKKQKSNEGIFFTYSEDEKFLIDFLQTNQTITFSKFIRVAQISRNRALEVLSNFVLLKIILLNSSNSLTTFSLNEEFDKDELKKFR